MAGSFGKQYMASLLVVFLFFISCSSSLSAPSHSCDPEEEASSFSYVCHSNLLKCHTFAILRANSLSNHLGLICADEFVLQPQGQLLLIPIDCRCNGRVYEAHLIKTCVKGDTFRCLSVSARPDHLPVPFFICRSIREKNPDVSEDKLGDNVKLRLAIRCSCPEEDVSNASFLVTYPVSVGDSVSSLAVKFNTTEDAIVSANNKSGVVPLKHALIPFDHKPVLDPLAKPKDSGSQKNVTTENHHPSKKKRSKMKLMIAVNSVIAVVCGLITFGYLHWKKDDAVANAKLDKQ